MTDKEKAEEYATEIAKCKECINHNFCHKIENKYLPKCEKWEWLFIGIREGLTEGRKEKWHDLRKNPDDLPKDEEVLKEYLVAYQNFNNPNEIVVGCFTWNGVRFLENYDYSEIPYFENKMF